MDRRVDLGLSAGTVLLGVSLFLMTLSIPRGSVADPVGSRGMLQFLALVLVITGAVLTARRLRTWKQDEGRFIKAEGSVDTAGHPASGWRAMAMAGLGLLFGLLLEPVGFPILTPILLAAALLLMDVRSIRLLVGYSLGLTLIVHAVFVVMFDVFLPLGPLSPWQDILWVQF